eukprot:gb/GECG01006633.1/.p1 GENE.gb/GECG01006633.1/~~gb/GECG01006633.1/.p1  ORF type:complete len:587 (+),score=134.16 gb/GECG01006633.1/:1-1761(+)
MADKSTSRDQPSDASAGGYTGHITTERAHPAREDSSSSVLPPPPAEDSPTQLKQQNAYLREEVKRLKESMSKLVSSAEMEEEYITNKLMKKLSTLKQEKEKLALEVDREEEFLTNTLQKKLSKVQQEKEEAQQRLDQEQEYVVNKLRRELSSVVGEKEQLEEQLKREREHLEKKAEENAKEKQELEDRLRREERHIEETLRAKLDRVLREKVELENHLEQEQEYIVNKLQYRLDTVTKQKEDLEKKLCSAQEDILNRLDEIVTDMASKATGDQMPVIGRMQNEIQQLQKHRDTVQHQYQTLKQGNESMEVEIKRLKDEKFTLSQKLAAERDRAEKLAKQNSELTLNLEVDSERAFNESTKSRSGSFSWQGQHGSFSEFPQTGELGRYDTMSPSILNASGSELSADFQRDAGDSSKTDSGRTNSGEKNLYIRTSSAHQVSNSALSYQLSDRSQDLQERLCGRERSLSSGGRPLPNEGSSPRGSSLLGPGPPAAQSTGSRTPFSMGEQFHSGTPAAPSVGLQLDLDSGDTHAHFARTLVEDDMDQTSKNLQQHDKEGQTPNASTSGSNNPKEHFRHRRSASYTGVERR